MTCFIFRRGPNKWRDAFLPIDLLDDWIKSKGLPEAEWAPDGKSVTIDGDVYSIDQFGKADNYCLSASLHAHVSGLALACSYYCFIVILCTCY